MKNARKIAVTLAVIAGAALLLALQVVAFAEPLPAPVQDEQPSSRGSSSTTDASS